MNKPWNWILTSVLVAITLGVVLFVSYMSIKRISMGESTRSWQEVFVTIKNAKVERVGSGKGTRYCLRVNYIYYVNNKKYLGNQYEGGGNCLHSRNEAKQAIYKFRKYRLAYYNKEKPWLSVMHRGASKSSWSPVAILVTFLTPFFVTAFFYFLASRTAKSNNIEQV